MEDEIVKQWINSIDFKKLASECKSNLDSESFKKQNAEYFSKEMTRLLVKFKEKFGIHQCSENQFVGPVEFKEFDLTNTEDLNECYELVLSKLNFLDTLLQDKENKNTFTMKECRELQGLRMKIEQRKEEKRRSEQYKRLKEEGII